MAAITEDMRRMLAEQRLGFVATVCPDGTPNLSPKGVIAVFDEEHLVFADIRSPNTVANLKANPAIEINVVDQTLRKGWRFKGKAEVLSAGERFDQLLAFLRGGGAKSPIRNIVLVKVERAAPLISPAYDQGQSEAEVAARWDEHWQALRRVRSERT